MGKSKEFSRDAPYPQVPSFPCRPSSWLCRGQGALVLWASVSHRRKGYNLRMRPISRGNSRRSLDGGATCRKTAISRSALDKNAMPRHLFEDSVDEGTTRRGTDTPVHRPEKPTGSTHSSTRGLSPRAQLKRQAEFHSPHRTRPDSPVPNLLGPFNPNQKWRPITRPVGGQGGTYLGGALSGRDGTYLGRTCGQAEPVGGQGL